MKHIAILRGINVGGKRKLLMADLRTLFTNLGFENVATYIQSGNVLFDHPVGADPQQTALRIKEAIAKTFGYDVPVIVLPAADLIEAIQSNPYSQTNSADINRLHLTFLSQLPDAQKVAEISVLDFSPDQFQVIGKHIFLRCESKYHKTKLNNQFFEKKLGVDATTRNWKTVLKLGEMVEAV